MSRPCSIARKLVAPTGALAIGAVVLLSPAPAGAHFRLDAPASWMSQAAQGGPQKNGPCAATGNTALGDPAGTPTGVVTAFQSGQTISVTVTATVAHPGWWRIALVEGASSTQTLASLPDPQAQAGTNCTPAIMNNPVWSPTQPVLADGLPAGSTATTMQSGMHTFQVTLPASATCTTATPCTVQVIMVMTDHPATDCYYHHCADITVGSAGADGGGSDGSTSVSQDASGRAEGSVGPSDSGGSTGGGDSSVSSSSSSSGSATTSGAGSSGSGAGMVGGNSSSSGGSSNSSSGGGSVAGSSGGMMSADGSPAGTAAETGKSGGGSSGGCLMAAGGRIPAPDWLGVLVALMGLARRRRRT